MSLFPSLIPQARQRILDQSVTMWQSGLFLLVSWAIQPAIGSQQEPLAEISANKKHLLLGDDLIAFHKNLTQIESITYHEQEAGKWLAKSLSSQGYTVEKQYIDDDSGRFNVFAYLGKKRETDILVSSHYDTVRMPLSEYTSYRVGV